MQGRLKEGKETYALFLDVQKAYNTESCGKKEAVQDHKVDVRVFKECCIAVSHFPRLSFCTHLHIYKISTSRISRRPFS